MCARWNNPEFTHRFGASSPICDNNAAGVNFACFDQIIERSFAKFVNIAALHTQLIGSLILNDVTLRIRLTL